MSAVSDPRGGVGQRVFVDTNVLVYAYDLSAGEKHERARDLVEELWRTRYGCVSVQVLQEFFVNVPRKIPKPLSTAQAKEIVSDLSYWKLHSPTGRDVVEAIDLNERHELSFWDSMIVRSAVSLGCNMVLTEDLNPGQAYDGLTVENPFQGHPGT
ncbi:MAG: PIN domain-containing protein [Rubrobacter sp.]|nr:PIN domain-containing protein [Rubrobacter sp.]